MSSVTGMSELFRRCYPHELTKERFREKGLFNDDISRCDVSNVTDMSEMFLHAHSFNQTVADWVVSNVTYMCHVCFAANVFN